jgi:hypothetical protein
MERYLHPEDNKTFALHGLVYCFAIFAGIQQIISKDAYSIFQHYLIGNGKRFIDDASRFV